MTQAGEPDSKILARIRESGTVYRLTAQEVVSLHSAGVSFTVLDYMMQSYIELVRADQRYADDNYWTNYYNHWYWCRPPQVIYVPRR